MFFITFLKSSVSSPTPQSEKGIRLIFGHIRYLPPYIVFFLALCHLALGECLAVVITVVVAFVFPSILIFL